MLVCVFCETVYQDALICRECNDYKGLMPIQEASATYDFLEYLTEEK